jgi:hypothetical protein
MRRRPIHLFKCNIKVYERIYLFIYSLFNDTF